jgi:hypothetical protein
MDLSQAEDLVLEYFRERGFHIREWPRLHPALEWRPRMRVTRRSRRRTSDAAVVVRESGTSYREVHNWVPLVEARKQLPHLSIYFAIPEEQRQGPLLLELQDLGIGLYVIKPDGHLHRVQEDRVPFEDQTISYPISPDLPYRNRINVYKAFANCTDYLWWMDKHFRCYGLELLEDFCSQTQVLPFKEVRVLCSSEVGQSELNRLRRQCTQLRLQLANSGIQLEMRVLRGSSLLSSIHDRYIISSSAAFNLPPVGSLRRGQQGSITLDETPTDFSALWNQAQVL